VTVAAAGDRGIGRSAIDPRLNIFWRRLKDAAVRGVLRGAIGAYLRVRVHGAERLPSSAYIACINHPSWSDPLLMVAYWPDTSRRLWIFGPRERDISVGRRNALIRWTGRGVAFQPGGTDIVDVTRRATGVLRAGGILVIAGEGRLSDREGELLPLEPGLGRFALIAGVPIVPVAISGTRWLRFGKTIRISIGAPIDIAGVGRGRLAAAELTARVEESLRALLDGLAPHDDRMPDRRFGRWLSEAFNERPWLTEPDWDPGRRPGSGRSG
jgi:1-acyl-sn-glycerol-3-phosphate acyltransferase